MPDGDGLRGKATDLGRIRPRARNAISKAFILERGDRRDWLKFRAGGRGIASAAATFTHTSPVTLDAIDEDSVRDTFGFTKFTKAVFFFQKAGESRVTRLGSLDGFNSESAFVLPKGEGTYFIKVTRPRGAYGDSMGYSLSIDFSESNLGTDSGAPLDSQFFF